MNKIIPSGGIAKLPKAQLGINLGFSTTKTFMPLSTHIHVYWHFHVPVVIKLLQILSFLTSPPSIPLPWFCPETALFSSPWQYSYWSQLRSFYYMYMYSIYYNHCNILHLLLTDIYKFGLSILFIISVLWVKFFSLSFHIIH